MNLTKIKQLVKQNGDKFIFIENGEPEFVMMSYHEYEKIFSGGMRASFLPENPFSSGRKLEVKRDAVLEETEFVPPQAIIKKAGGLPMRAEEIRLEDLPL